MGRRLAVCSASVRHRIVLPVARSCYEAPPRGVTRDSPSCRDFLDTAKWLYKRKTEDEESEFLQ